MTVNRTTLLDLPLPVTGTESGTWGDTTNNGLTQYLDIAIAGSLVLSADSDTTLSSTEGDSSATNIGGTTAQYAVLRCTGARTTTRNINAPAWAISGGTISNYSKTYVVINDTTGGQSIVLRATNSATPTYTTGVTIVAGERAVCAWNGSDFVKVGGAAGGSNTQVQYNNNGVFGGITNATTDGTTLSMTSPKVITGINDTNGAELLKVTATASAVNELTLANAATGNAPTLSATGDDTNIGINITPKGTGVVTISNLAATTIDTTNIEVTNIKAIDGTAAASIANSTGVITSVKDQVINGVTVGRGAGSVSTNTAVGVGGPLASNTSGGNNTANGNAALGSNTTGSENTAIGSAALILNTTGSNNTAVGRSALLSNTTASSNTAVGYQAAYSNTTGAALTATGIQSLYSNTTASYNTAVGYRSLYNNTTGENNTGYGTWSLFSNTTASNNTAVGYQALYSNTTNGSNTAVGYQAGYNNTGDTNSFFGDRSGYLNTSGYYLAAYGRLSLYSNTTGISNTALGHSALYSNTTASYNTAVGYQAGYANVTGSGQVFVGYYAGRNSTAGPNTVVGNEAFNTNTTGVSNTVMGNVAMAANTTGSYNTAVGDAALRFNTTADYITGVGYRALYSNTTGARNTAVGADSLRLSTTGTDNTSVGYNGLQLNTTGSNNSAFGQGAIGSNTTGANNTGIGSGALALNTTASNNTAVGYQAGYSTTGASNVFVGHSSGSSITSGASNVILGCYTGASQGGLDLTTASSYIVLANGASNGDWFAYVNGVSTGNAWYQRSNTSSWATTSDARIKKNIVAVTNGLAIISALEPVEFDYILTNQHDVGFIAQDYQKVLPNQITQQDCISEEYRLLTNGEPVKGIQQNLVPYLVSAIQELKSELNTVKAELATLKGV